MNRSPREAFALSAFRAPMEKISQTEAFLAACEYAQLIQAEEITDTMNPTGLAQIIGARRVLEILKTIHEPIKETKSIKPKDIYNLK